MERFSNLPQTPLLEKGGAHLELAGLSAHQAPALPCISLRIPFLLEKSQRPSSLEAEWGGDQEVYGERKVLTAGTKDQITSRQGATREFQQRGKPRDLENKDGCC